MRQRRKGSSGCTIGEGGVVDEADLARRCSGTQGSIGGSAGPWVVVPTEGVALEAVDSTSPDDVSISFRDDVLEALQAHRWESGGKKTKFQIP
uniref:Uncharacterized protein n=1 Tax=Oryza punctata TaxID=4537 RepID=A0A0E0LWJ6_ORYPU